jgi:hypothetical protein
MTQTDRKREIRLGEFTRAGLEEQASRLDVEFSVLVRQAVIYYLADRDSDRPGWRLPRFVSGTTNRAEISVELDERTWEALAEAARLQGVDQDRLLEHAVLYYLADLESGRAAARIVRSIADEPSDPESHETT